MQLKLSSGRNHYFISDFYLIIAHIALLSAVYLWQSNYPYIAEHNDGMFITDLFMCSLFAIQSALIAWIGLNCMTIQDKDFVPVFRKLLLGCIYAIFIAKTMLYISHTSYLHHQQIIKIILTFSLFFGSVYFSILRYAKLRTIDYIGLFIIFLITLSYFIYNSY